MNEDELNKGKEYREHMVKKYKKFFGIEEIEEDRPILYDVTYQPMMFPPNSSPPARD